MFNWLKKHFSSNILSSDEGSVLSVALLVIAVLTFAVTSVTNISLNLSAQTRQKLAQTNDDSIAKIFINQAIIEFKDYVNIVGLESVDLNSTSVTDLYDRYTVTVTELEAFRYDDTTNNEYGRHYVFSYTKANDAILKRDLLITNSEFDPEDISVFDYTVGTNQKLYMNSGYYNEVNIFGASLWLAGTAPYEFGGSYDESTSEVFPVLTPNSVPSTIYFNNSYNYCEATCFDTTSLPLVFNESTYQSVPSGSLADTGDYDTLNIVDFFGNFDFKSYATTFIAKKGPSQTLEITDEITYNTIETVVLNNSEPLTMQGTKLKWPNNAKYVDITSYVNEVDFTKDFTKEKSSMVYNGDLTLTSDIKMKMENNQGNKTFEESLVVLGDLTLNKAGKQTIDGTIIVTGDLFITGDDISMEGSFLVLGEIFVDMNPTHQFLTPGRNFGLTFMAGNNVYILSHNSGTSSINNVFDFFVYTERSIYIDALSSSLNYTGSLFARGSNQIGNELDINNDDVFGDVVNDIGDPIRGIIINSGQGYINGSGSFIPQSSTNDIRFRAEHLDGVYQERFDNIPVFENSLLFQAGIYVFKTSEFYEE